MLQHLVAALVIIGLLATVTVLPVVMVRDLIRARRERSGSGSVSSGIAGMMVEIDRAVRPSVQHVMEAEELADKEDDDIGGE